MSLSPGTRLGPYEVTDKLGQGGMGEVFRARDTQLGRDVAIKVLPDAFARDAERLARFRREAQALAALNDPRIAQIYRLEETGQSVALVMEFVEGRTLAELVALGPLDLDDALRFAAQMAAGLEVAHERGIVHRDLKPANVKITPDGQVKILDFGLAKAMAADPASSEMMNSPTLTARATEAGVILGTAAYMSPEQARGKTVDKRTDIWAFGAVLYEMLTGRRAFEGETTSDTLAAVLRSEPDWSKLDARVPAHVRALLTRSLERDASRRLRDIGEARLALESGSTISGIGAMTGGAASAPAITQPPARPWLWIAAAGLLGVTTIVFASTSTLWRRPPVAPAEASLELALTAPDGAEFQIGSNSGNVIVSPDGSKIAFVASTAKSTTLWVRSLGADDARPLSGTEGAFNPFWSPDGRQIAFFASGKLRRVDIAGGLPEVMADAPYGRGGSWSEDGTIIFTPNGGTAIVRVAATGGPVTPVTTLDENRGENAHYWPVFLPGGSRYLYFVRSIRVENNGIYLARLDGSEPAVRLVASLSSGVAAVRPSTGGTYLLWVRDGDLLAQPLDVEAAALRGDAVTIARGVRVEESQRLTYASASQTGLVAWATERAAELTLGLYGRDGRRLRSLDVPAGRVAQPALSPDGRRLLFMRADKGSADVHLHDLLAGTTQRVTVSPDYDELPTWTPDGRAMYYSGVEEGQPALFRVELGEGAEPASIHRGPGVDSFAFETPDRRFVVFSPISPVSGSDVTALQQFGARGAIALAAGPANEAAVGMSRDGRWLLLASDAGNRPSLALVRLRTDGDTPTLGGSLQVAEGLDFGVLRSDGREVFVMSPDGVLTAIPVTPAGDSATLGAASPLFRIPSGRAEFTVNADGTQFIAVETPFAAGQTLRVLTNWEQRLAR